ncbi:unnamed protein product [Leptidea sinapis]|uniref:Uncharacterized protein n=1 Tax=Leptidea sinapis TaxID=189913 RepID=A0A5E4QQA9_9NEOP|nr:unnamed protein product [Leptidea sinapis]
MYRNCLQNFLKNTNPANADRHYDSSDFEDGDMVASVASKRGTHSFLITEPTYPDLTREVHDAVKHTSYEETRHMRYNRNAVQETTCRDTRETHRHTKHRNKESKNDTYKSKGDAVNNIVNNTSSRCLIRNKVLPVLSVIFRRSSNNKNIKAKRLESIDEDRLLDKDANNSDYCVNCKRRENNINNENSQIKQRNKHRYNNAVKPVYAVADTSHNFLYSSQANRSPLVRYNRNNKFLNSSINISSSSGSDVDLKQMNTKRHLRKRENKVTNQYDTYQCQNQSQRTEHKELQFPSKYRPCQVVANASCQFSSNNNSVNSKTSSSSSFWDYLAVKLNRKRQKAPMDDCCCTAQQCNAENCLNLNTVKIPQDHLPTGTANYEPTPGNISGRPSPLKKIARGLISPKKRSSSEAVECKCKLHQGKQFKPSSPQTDPTMQQTSAQQPIPNCQQSHDAITNNLAAKYNGEILCIHNPPCVLINGCLNLPPRCAEPSNYWLVSTHTNTDFYDENPKETSPNKDKEPDLYSPPYSNIQECLPEFRSEKIVQSVCNHIPPCEVVRGCFKAKYDPKLKDSCVHVPMCEKLPQCVTADGLIAKNKLCSHNPKCFELPLCSQKFLTLTAKEDISTQVQPKTKFLCRHKPPCIMIPKCLARALCGDYIPREAIPDCVHCPTCELIPACCRKAAKELMCLSTFMDEGISLKMPQLPLHHKKLLLKLLQAK